jgi:hypothetical protein
MQNQAIILIWASFEQIFEISYCVMICPLKPEMEVQSYYREVIALAARLLYLI